MSDTNRIVVGFDGSPDAGRAARWAARVGAELPATIVDLVHAATLPPVPAHPSRESVDELLAAHETEAEKLLAAEQRALADLPVEVHRHVRRWLPVETVLEHARETSAGLIVVGRHGRWSTHVLLGSVSSQIAREAAVPVVVIRGEDRAAPPRRILLAADGSLPSRRAAGAIAHWFPAAQVVAAHVRESGDEPDLAALAAGLAEAGLSRDRIELHLASGDVASALLELAAAEEIDLVAAGRRGHGGWHDLILGSIADKLLQLAPCPVLVAH